MRTINHIVIHCTATPQTATVESIQRYWRVNLGWKNPGYHWLIKPDGEAVALLPIEQVSNGVAGHNSDSIHISYIGGVDGSGKPIDNRTWQQVERMAQLIKKYRAMFPEADVLGHCDFPGVAKACPSFSVKAWMQTIGICMILSLTLFACGTRKKHIQQERERTEQTASERTEQKTETRREKGKQDIELVDSQGVTSTKVYGAEGTIGPDGSFTGKADSATTTSNNRNLKLKGSSEGETADSTGASLAERLDSLVHGKETNERIQEVRRSVPWWMWVCISALVIFSLWFGVWKRGVLKRPLNWIFKLFK